MIIALVKFNTTDRDKLIILFFRLSRARRCVENSFGILTARWVCLARTLFAKPDRAQAIVAACCALHNFMLTEHKDDYSPPGFADYFDAEGNLVEGKWRKKDFEVEPVTYKENHGRPPTAAVKNRDTLCEYFNSPTGSLAWQDIAITK